MIQIKLHTEKLNTFAFKQSGKDIVHFSYLRSVMRTEVYSNDMSRVICSTMSDIQMHILWLIVCNFIHISVQY